MITATDLVNMRAGQAAIMHDTCELLTLLVGAKDAYNRPQEQYQVGASQACGLDMRASREVQEQTQVPLYDARLRLPVDTDIDHLARVRITHRYGEELADPLYYDVVGEPLRGPSGILLNLRTATTETVEAIET